MVDRQRAPPSDAADQLPAPSIIGCADTRCTGEPGEYLLQVGAGVDHHQLAAHDVVEPGEAVVAGGVVAG